MILTIQLRVQNISTLTDNVDQTRETTKFVAGRVQGLNLGKQSLKLQGCLHMGLALVLRCFLD